MYPSSAPETSDRLVSWHRRPCWSDCSQPTRNWTDNPLNHEGCAHHYRKTVGPGSWQHRPRVARFPSMQHKTASWAWTILNLCRCKHCNMSSAEEASSGCPDHWLWSAPDNSHRFVESKVNFKGLPPKKKHWKTACREIDPTVPKRSKKHKGSRCQTSDENALNFASPSLKIPTQEYVVPRSIPME